MLGEVGVLEELDSAEDLQDEGYMGDVSHMGDLVVPEPPVMIPPTWLKMTATQDPESPVVKNALDVLSAGITGHSLDSWYLPAK